MPLNFDLAGKTYPTVTATVTPEQIDAYARAAHDANPRYAAGPDQVAPPAFAVVPALQLAATVGRDPELGVENPLMILHGEQEFHYHSPLRPGRLVLTPTLTSVEDKGSGATYVVRIDARTDEGEPVVDQLWTIFVRGAGRGAARPAAEQTAAPGGQLDTPGGQSATPGERGPRRGGRTSATGPDSAAGPGSARPLTTR